MSDQRNPRSRETPPQTAGETSTETPDRSEMLRALRAFKSGDFSVRLPSGLPGVDGELAGAFNELARVGEDMTQELARIRNLADNAGSPAAKSQRRRTTDSADQIAARQAEAQLREDALQRINQQLRENARQLSEQMKQIEDKNRQVELAKALLEEKAEQLALSSRYQSEFLANMSHELRTPLNSLLILAQMLAENPAGNLNPKQVEFAQTIQAAGNDLLTLINDVLDLAKIESGTVTLHFTTESFAELQDDLNRAFQQIGHDKDLQFRISMDRNLPPAIRTDARLLRQILKNLLSNAFKFTPEGAVSIEVAMGTSGWTPGHPVLDEAREVVAFSVADTGIGIATDKQQIIFEAFRQADGTTSRHFGGTGLGLSISTSLAHLLGGEIKVRSAPGRGSTFALYLPLVASANGGSTHHAGGPALGDPDETPLLSRDVTAAPARAQDPLPPVIGKAMPELAGRKVLIVDDDIRGIFALTSALESQAMVVVHAENGADAIDMLASSPGIDIILMDMMMPGLDGYETIRIVRGLEEFRSVPIIGISAKAMKGDRDKAIGVGASDYMSKPVDIVQLLSLIRARLAAWENPGGAGTGH